MTSPSNPTAAAPNARTLASRTVELRTGLIAAFLATCVFFFFIASSAAVQHDRSSNARVLHLPGFGCSVSVSFWLPTYSWFLISRREQKSIAMGAGIACGLFGGFLLVSPYVLMAMFLFVGMSAWNGPPDRGLMAAGLVVVAVFVISLWIVWSAFRIGKIQWNTFGAAVAATAFYLYFGFHSLSLMGFRGQQRAEQKRVQSEMDMYKPAMLARQKIVAITACLLRNHIPHPEAGYPASIDPLPPGYTCDPSLPTDQIPEFTFTYTPQTDPANGRVTDFQLTAMPGKKGIRGREPLLVDSRGVVFVDYPWEMENVTPQVMVTPSDVSNSQIDGLKFNLDRYIKDKGNGLAPATLNAEIAGGGYVTPIIEEGRTRLEARDYETLYLEPRAGDPTRFALSAQCKSYGQNCLRSYFVDYDGSMHATAEPRPATADDPPPLRCEKITANCENIIWDPI